MSGKIATVLFAALVTAACLVPLTSEAGPRGRHAKTFNPGAGAVAIMRKRGPGRRLPGNLGNPVPTTSGISLITPAVQSGNSSGGGAWPYPCADPNAHAPGC